MALFKLNAQVKIGPSFPATIDITDYIISIRRDYSICDFSQRFILEVDTILWRNLVKAMVQLNPGTCVEIYEHGVKVLTGFFSRITRARKPDNVDILEGQDTYKLAMDFFNENETETAHGETIDYWAGTLLARCGLNYISDNPKAGLKTVPLGTEFGFRTIHECLITLAAYAAGYFFVDSGGNVRLSKGRALGVPDIIIAGGPVSDGYFTNPSTFYTRNSGGNVFGGYYTTDDVLTRNRAIVWGWYGPDHVFLPGESSFIKADVISDNITPPVTRTVLYASPAIQDQNTAWTLAQDIVNQLSNYTEVVAWDVQGNPDFRVGGRIFHNNNFLSATVSGYPLVRLATTVNSQMDKDGYTAHIRVGERCPRFAGWTSASAINRAVWIAGISGGFGSDPVPQKLIWTGDLSGLGEPTFNLVQGIPAGIIDGMEVCRDNSAVFLLTRIAGLAGTHYQRLYWADAQEIMAGNGTWTEICHGSNNGTLDGTSLGGGYVIDGEYFTNQAIYSIQCVGKTLYIGVRANNGSVRRHFYGEWKNGTLTWYGPVLGNDTIAAVASKDIMVHLLGGGFTSQFYNPKTSSAVFTYAEDQGFPGTPTLNGVSPVNTGLPCPGFFVTELNDGNWVYGTSSGGVAKVRKNTAIIDTGRTVDTIKGDYYGNQLQYVIPDASPGNTGFLYMSPDGSSFSQTLTWIEGMCICISDSTPSLLYWIGHTVTVGNEIGRFSSDGGQSFVPNLGTGNWWGTNAEVLNGSKIQSDGTWILKNIHPTFEVSLV